MRERKYIKLKVNMYEDTKFKIIDTMEDRDLIHYIWTRLVTLAGKVNLDGDLYMSRNIPYTDETLSIEFNRSIEKVKLALNVLKDLEMVELSENKVYRVRNFAKHQNIKVKEKSKNVDNKKDINNKEDIIKNIADNDIENNKILDLSKATNEKNAKEKDISNKEIKIIEIKNDKNQKSSVDTKDIQNNKCSSKEKLDTDFSFNSPLLSDKKRNQKRTSNNNKKKGNNDINQIDEDYLVEIFDGIDMPERKGDTVVKCFQF